MTTAALPKATLDSTIFEELRALGRVCPENFLEDLAEQFFQETEHHLEDLSAAFRDGDAHAVVVIAHAIQGGSSQMGGSRLAFACLSLQRKVNAGSLPGAEPELLRVEVDYQDLRRELQSKLGRAVPGHSLGAT